MAINKVIANDETLIDLTNDTAEAEDVLEGQTFHLRSGAIATGTYRPSDEIEARLEATVGHSSKNLLPITIESEHYTTDGADLSYTVDRAAGTITLTGTTKPSGSGSGYIPIPIPDTLYGNLYLSGGYNDNCYIRVRDNTAGAYCKKWDGSNTVGSKGESDSEEVTLVQGHTNVIRLLFAAGQDFSNVVIKPMLRDGSISDDTFEPYVQPTDERIIALEARVAALEAALNS